MRSLDVTTLQPIPCPACGGQGGQTVERIPSRPWSRTSPDYVWVPCEDCAGTGEEPCACCGERAAVTETDLGLYCAACAEEEA